MNSSGPHVGDSVGSGSDTGLVVCLVEELEAPTGSELITPEPLIALHGCTLSLAGLYAVSVLVDTFVN